MAAYLFWISLSFLVYAFIGYPTLLKCLAFLRPQPVRQNEGHTPFVSILLSVYNEEAVIKRKIENFLELDYPADRIEFMIVSDGCEDRTEEIVRQVGDARIILHVQEKRGGKTRALNSGATRACGDILVFTDANSMFDRGAVRKLVRNFADPAIGLVSGRSIYFDPETGSTTTGGAYRRYEDFIKKSESSACSIIGADGAIYAMRKSLYEELKPEYINDFIHTIQCVLKGYRAISDDEAICREEAEERGSGEFRRQTRIMAQSWLIFCSQVGSLLVNGEMLYVWGLVSHKFLRWLTVPLMVALFTGNAMLIDQHMLFAALMAGQITFLVAAVVGGRFKAGIMRVPYMFTLLHVASLFGLYNYLQGNMFTTWNPRNN